MMRALGGCPIRSAIHRIPGISANACWPGGRGVVVVGGVDDGVVVDPGGVDVRVGDDVAVDAGVVALLLLVRWSRQVCTLNAATSNANAATIATTDTMRARLRCERGSGVAASASLRNGGTGSPGLGGRAPGSSSGGLWIGGRSATTHSKRSRTGYRRSCGDGTRADQPSAGRIAWTARIRVSSSRYSSAVTVT